MTDQDFIDRINNFKVDPNNTDNQDKVKELFDIHLKDVLGDLVHSVVSSTIDKKITITINLG